MPGSWFHASVRTICRSAGRSATAAAAYRAGVDITDTRTGELHDYTRKRGVEHTAVFVPAGAPAWAHDRAVLWNAAEAAERRKDARVARELIMALPAEVTADVRLAILKDIAGFLVRRYGVAVDVALHRPHRDGDQRNHHAHLLFSTRCLGRDGFSEKTRVLDSPKTSGPEVTAIRAEAARLINRELERAGLDYRVDHRSNDDRGIDREATAHRGPAANEIERRGGDSRIGRQNRETQARNAGRAEREQQAKVIDLAVERSRRAAERERERFEAWENTKRAELQSQWLDREVAFGRRHDEEKARLQEKIAAFYAPARQAFEQERRQVEARLQKDRGLRGLVRRLTGKHQADHNRLEDIGRSQADAARRIQELHDGMTARQEVERQALADRRRQEETALEQRLIQARERRERQGWTRDPPRVARERTTEDIQRQPGSIMERTRSLSRG